MNDEEVLRERRCALKKSVENLSNANKHERDRWALTQFLRNLGVAFADEEVRPQLVDPPDVIFRGDEYEIKEVLDAGRRRQREYKEAFAKACAIRNPADLVELVKDVDPLDIAPQQIGELISGKDVPGAKPEGDISLVALNNKYAPGFRASTNLLYYVDLTRHQLSTEPIGPMPAPESFSRFGWRSISVLISWGALVFFARADAPDFIRDKVSTISLRRFK